MLWHRLRFFDEDIVEELEDKCGDTEYLPQRNVRRPQEASPKARPQEASGGV